MWSYRNTFSIGNLENIGYAPGQDLLIVLSTQGQGIFECSTGSRIARKQNGLDWWTEFDETFHTIQGFDQLDGVVIPTSGLYGGDKMCKQSNDGWTLVVSEPSPDDSPYEQYTVQRIFLVSPGGDETIVVGKSGPCELRAFGFSDTGASFVIAESCNLVIYSRA